MSNLQRFILRNYADKILSRWVVLLYDIIVTFVAFLVAYFIRFNFHFPLINEKTLLLQLAFVLSAYMGGFLIYSSYSGIIRHTGLTDIMKLCKACVTAAGILIAFSLCLRYIPGNTTFVVPLAIVIVHFLLCFSVLSGMRFCVKLLYHNAMNNSKNDATRVLIYGAGYSGIVTRHTLDHDSNNGYRTIAFVDDNPRKNGKYLDGIRIFSLNNIDREFVIKYRIKEMIIAIPKLSPKRKSDIIEHCLHINVKVKDIPQIDTWINGEFHSHQIRNVKIDDLLGRQPINLDKSLIRKEIKDKVVMVTGAAGSIGSEISRLILDYEPSKLILIDQAESALHDLEMAIQLMDKEFAFDIVFIVSDIKNLPRLTRLFDSYRPQIVYHAAAYKHVPMMEQNPVEATHVNIFGTKNLVDLSVIYEVEKFVFISTTRR